MTYVTDDGKCPGHASLTKGCPECAIERLLAALKAITTDVQVADIIRARKLIQEMEGKR